MVIMKNKPFHSHMSSLLQHYAFHGRVPLCMPSWLLVLECMQKFTNLLVWIDSASFNHFVPVSVCDTAVFRSTLIYWIYDHLL